jgi:hypothetical protein
MYTVDSPASMSILEEATVFAERPMIGAPFAPASRPCRRWRASGKPAVGHDQFDLFVLDRVTPHLAAVGVESIVWFEKAGNTISAVPNTLSHLASAYALRGETERAPDALCSSRTCVSKVPGSS